MHNLIQDEIYPEYVDRIEAVDGEGWTNSDTLQQ